MNRYLLTALASASAALLLPAHAQSTMAGASASTTAAAVPARPALSDTVRLWVRLADENNRFALSEPTSVRYGTDTRFASKLMQPGVHDCRNGTFDGDPAPGRPKLCEKQVEVPRLPTTTDPAGRGPPVNLGLIPPPSMGFTEARIRSTWYDPKTGQRCEPNATGCVVDDPEKIHGSDIGAFREPCGFSHMNADDPIVFPGKPGVAHLHSYFGNVSVNAFSTQESLARAKASTCQGGILNLSAYWVPSLIDTSNGRPVVPGGMLVYYKGNYQFDQSKLTRPYPAGLRMIAGNARNEDPSKATGAWICYGPKGENPGASPTIAQAVAKGTCHVGGELGLGLNFPLCWDGVNLDSPDHASHMSYPVFDAKANKHGCPASHPKVLPNMTINVGWKILPGDDVSRWRLSSDLNPAAEAGVSAHGDYWFNWDEKTNARWTRECIGNLKDGHASLTCDGYTLY